MMIKSFFPACALALLLTTGCARNYVITLNNGTQLGANGKPYLQNGMYHYKDARGNDAAIAAARVSEIEPASQAMRDQKKTRRPAR